MSTHGKIRTSSPQSARSLLTTKAALARFQAPIPFAPRFSQDLVEARPVSGIDADVSSSPVERSPWRDSKESVLPAREFDLFLQRERKLADRSTRLFSLIVLRRPKDERQELAQLSRELRNRLRSTDVVGFLDGDRLALLLTDTKPDGAKVVARMVDDVVAKLGIRVERLIYVYPSVDDHDDEGSDRGHDGHSNGNGHVRSNGSNGTNRARDRRSSKGAAHTRSTDRIIRRITTIGAPEPVAPRPSHWKIESLWSELSVATPFWKRCVDVFGASIALLLLLPLFAVLALAIRLDSNGPVFFSQLRAGRGGRPFKFYKFRSMFTDAEKRRAELAEQNEADGPVFKMRDDPRVTRVGRLLRRWSLDELPQLWNVLKGDISLVGPRSPTMDEISKYERWQRRRLNVAGGITCIWQVSGRSQITFRDWMRMDMQYVTRRSLWLDLQLLVRTLPAVLSGRGAY